MNHYYDIAITGSGFAGSLMAIIARRLGKSVVLIERGKHPRVVIGESSTPLSNLLLEELATKYDLPAIRPLAKWGTWQQNYPELPCGLKRGFSFFHHERSQPQSPLSSRDKQLLVAASPHNTIADTHWYRADFDHFLAQQAQQAGAAYFDETIIEKCSIEEDRVDLEGKQNGRDVRFTANFLIDATGPRGFLHKALNLKEQPLPGFPQTQALYSYFTGVKQLQASKDFRFEEQPPYPIDAAAVHHILDGGWIWILQFNNGITSAGIAATDALAASLNLSEGQPAWSRLLQQIPALREQFSEAEPIQPFRHIPQLSFRSAIISGKNWAMLPSAAGFVDPLLSTGFPLTLLGVTRLAKIIQDGINEEKLKQYAAKTDAELLATARLIAALYANMSNFQVFSALTLLYFAAASYAETARRLNKPQLAPSFLLHDHPTFGTASKHICEQALQSSNADQLIEEIYRAIESIDVAGLTNRNRHNWYPVEAEDLFRAAHKVDASREEIEAMLTRCGFQPATSLQE